LEGRGQGRGWRGAVKELILSWFEKPFGVRESGGLGGYRRIFILSRPKLKMAPHEIVSGQGTTRRDRWVERLRRFNGSPEGFGAALLQAQCELAGAEAGALLRLVDEGRARVVASYPAMAKSEPAPRWLRQASAWLAEHPQATQGAIEVVEQGQALYGQTAQTRLILLPVRDGMVLRGVAAFVVAGATAAAVEQQRGWLELSLGLLDLYEMQLTLQQRQVELSGLASVAEVQASTNEHDGFKAAAMALCNEVAARWRAERVSLGVLVGSYVQVKAMSQSEHFSRKMKLVQRLESAMEECLDQDVEVLYPAPVEATYVSRAAQELSNQHGPMAVCSLPLRRGGRVVGVLTLERGADERWEAAELEFLRLGCEMLTPRLMELFERGRWFGARAAASGRRMLGRLVGPEHTWAKAGAAAALVAVMLAVLLKGEQRVQAPFVVETIAKQVIPAPFDGYLKSVAVEAGEDVVAGVTVLATLETAELRLEKVRLEAQRQGHLKDADIARRETKPVEVQIAQAKAAEAMAQIQWIDYQVEQARIVSPMSGVVTEGDLKRQIGAPVRKGDVLFEVAPLDAVRAVLHVSDDAIAEVRQGQDGQLATAANPGVYLTFEVEQINPVAEVINSRNVFRVRGKFAGEAELLRPGMEGVAKITVGEQPYAWLWTRGAVRWLRMKLWL
jgi:biotin carboxyl carrier protein